MSKPKSSSSDPRGRHWCVTVNNPTYDLREFGLRAIKAGGEFVVQLEKGADEETPHMQGYVRFPSQRKFSAVKKIWPRGHIEKAKGSVRQNVAYCTKKDTRVDGPLTNLSEEFMPPEEVKDPLEGKELYRWQHQVKQILEDDCAVGDRTIYWFWEDSGNVGKTSLAKHLCLTFRRTFYTSGKAGDVKYAIAQMPHKPKTVLWDVPRTMERFVSYQGIEEVKNGIFFSGKYESGTVMFNTPHVIVFANFPPDRSKLSEDRWDVYQVVDGEAREDLQASSHSFGGVGGQGDS